MRLIQQYSCTSEAEAACEKLRKRGILTHISSERSYRLSYAQTGALKVGLWVVLNNQYHDACNVLTNKKYQVKHPLSEQEMQELEKLTVSTSTKFLLSRLLTGFILLLSVFGLVLYFMVAEHA